MRRRLPIKRLALALILGLVTTIAVAWYYAWVARDGYMHARWNDESGADLVPDTDPSDLVTSIELRREWHTGSVLVSVTYWPVAVRPRNASSDSNRGKVSFNRLHELRPIDDIVSPFTIEHAAPEFITLKPIAGVLPNGSAGITTRECLAAGWPMYALHCRSHCIASPPPAWRFEGSLNHTTHGFGSLLYLPYHPLPMGFAVNTTVYASLWAALFFAVAFMRRRLRIRRNLCPQCAYDLSATPSDRPCPECGGLTVERRPRVPQSKEPLTHN